jgi:hypothetical protein
MKYVKHHHNGHWHIVHPKQNNHEYLRHHGIFRLIEHKEPHESFDKTKWKLVEHLKLQRTLRIVHRLYEVVPIDAYEPDRPTIIGPQENTGTNVT